MSLGTLVFNRDNILEVNINNFNNFEEQLYLTFLTNKTNSKYSKLSHYFEKKLENYKKKYNGLLVLLDYINQIDINTSYKTQDRESIIMEIENLETSIKKLKALF
tara:strand:- start:1984 stop:2298 length:315 start_codon:yes stop_codon:yes gene_type:complete